MGLNNGIVIPSAIRRNLDRLGPALLAGSGRILLYPAGSLTEAVLASETCASLPIKGILDMDFSKHGTRLHGHLVHPLTELQALKPSLVLIASTRMHKNMFDYLAPIGRDCGFDVIDLCAGMTHFDLALDNLAERGLELDDADPASLGIIRPGAPRKIIRISRRHSNLLTFIAEHFDNFLRAVEPDRDDPDQILLDYSVPSYKTLVPSGVTLFLPSVYEGDAVIDRYLEWGQVKAGDTVLDIGAFAGDATYFFSKRVGGTGRVLAVEPDRLNAEALLRNVQDHHLANVQVASCAVWDTDGEALFDGDGTVGSGLVETLCRPTSEKIRVPTCTLATLLDRHGLDRVDCIKMDIEGAEVRVLRQCMERLRQLRPRLIIGPHELNDNNALGINARQASEGSTAYEVIRLLQEGGFSVQSVGGDIADANILATWP